jgi:sugar (pentulose or hexulose) kinase
MQLTADIFGLPAARPHVYEASGLGAAIDAAVGVKVHPDFKTAVGEMTHLGDVFEPNLDTQRVYTRLYNEVYLKMYDRLKPLYKVIRDITAR